MIGLFFLSIIIRIKFKRGFEYFVVVYSIIWLGFGFYDISRPQRHLSNNLIFLIGYSFAMWQNVIMAHFTRFRLVVVFSISIFILKSVFFYFSAVGHDATSAWIINLILDILNFYSRFLQEKNERSLFLQAASQRKRFLKFKSFLGEHLPDSLLILDKLTLAKLFVNQACQQAISSFSQQFGDFLKNLFVEEDPTNNQLVTETLASCLKDMQSIDLQEFLQRGINNHLFDSSTVVLQANAVQEGVKKLFEVKIFNVTWDNKDAIALLINDITHQETIISLKLANSQKDKMLATVSHELKTPLNGILGMIHIMKRQVMDKNFEEMIDVCQNNANLLLNIVNSILDLHLIRRNKLRIFVEKMNIRHILEDIRILFGYQCKKKGITLEIKIDDDIPEWIHSDKVRLSEILINLTFNAVKFTYKGGVILHVQSDPQSPDKILFSVKDSGIGIGRKDRERLLKIFGRIEDLHGDNTEGIGLGLAISHSLARMLDANKDTSKGLEIESKYNEGSTFSFSISQNLVQNLRDRGGSISVVGSSIDEDIVMGDKMTPYSTSVRSIALRSNFASAPTLRLLEGQHSLGLGGGAQSPLIKLEQVDLSGSGVNVHGWEVFKSEGEVASPHNFSKFSHESENAAKNLLTNEGEVARIPSETSESEIIPRVERKSFRTRTSLFKKDARKRSSLRQQNILIVDDNPFNILVAQKLIEDYGLNVKTALNGKEAIQRVQEEAEIFGRGFKMILMDLQMPVMDGFEATRTLIGMMEKGEILETPIVALTANDGEDDIEMCLNVGMKAHLSKPLKPKDLERVLNNF